MTELRVTLTSPEGHPERVRSVRDRLSRAVGGALPNLFLALARHPALLDDYLPGAARRGHRGLPLSPGLTRGPARSRVRR